MLFQYQLAGQRSWRTPGEIMARKQRSVTRHWTKPAVLARLWCGNIRGVHRSGALRLLLKTVEIYFFLPATPDTMNYLQDGSYAIPSSGGAYANRRDTIDGHREPGGRNNICDLTSPGNQGHRSGAVAGVAAAGNVLWVRSVKVVESDPGRRA